ncbi:Gfo/Idh/MocA family protein [Planctomycetota bacterium]
MALRIGLIGGGSVAGVHLAGYARIDEVARVRVAEVNVDAHAALRQQPKVADVVGDWRALLDDPSLDLIDICLPHHLHAQTAIAAFESGKAVICEKPIATTLDDADAMIAAAAAAHRPLYISHNMRFYPHHIRAKELLDEGAIGRPFLAVINVIGNELARMNDPQSWKGTWDKAGGGATIDTGFHATYTLHDFFGQPAAVTAVMARHVVTAPDKADDTAAVIFEFPGLTATLSITYAATHHPWDERREIHGTEGSLYITDRRPPRLRLVIDGEDTAVPIDEFANPFADSIAAALRHFVGCTITGQDPMVTAAESRAVLRTALAAYQSAREGRRIELL